MAKKMGTNPLTGLNGLIRNTQEPATAGSDYAVSAHGSSQREDEPGAYNAQAARHEYDTFLAQDVHEAHVVHAVHIEPATYDAPHTQGKKGQKLPRINMAFSPEHLAYLQAMAGFERMSATQYVNNLIKADMEKRGAVYRRLNEMRGRD